MLNVFQYLNTKNMISKTLKLSVLIIAICAVSFTEAQERQRKHRPSPEELFQKLDANDDGELSLDEFKDKRQRKEIKEETLNEHFKELDTDSNGSLSQEEFKARKEVMKQKRIEEHFSEMDKDGNGTIDLDEYKAFVENHKKERPQRKHGKNWLIDLTENPLA